MNRMSRNLSLALAAQLVLVAIMFWPASSSTDGKADASLLDFDSATINRLLVSDSETSLVLSRADQRWTLPEYHQLPADPAKITGALQTLPGLPRGWPVAQSAAAHQRFEVAADNYQRKLQFVTDSDTTRTLYLGTSPGFRKVHVRVEGEDALYAVEFNTFDLPITESEWLDQTLLQLSEISAIQGLDYLLRRDGEQWVMGTGETAQQAIVDSLLNGLKNLRVDGSVDIATAAMLRETIAPPTLTVTSGEKTYEYRLFQIKDAHYLQRADVDIYFSISALDHDRLNDVNAAALSGQDTAPAAAETADTENPGAT